MSSFAKALWAAAFLLTTIQYSWGMQQQDNPEDANPNKQLAKAIRATIQKQIKREDNTPKDPICVDALFLGPHGENAEMLLGFVKDALRDHLYWRRGFHPDDPFRITEEMKQSSEFLNVKDRLEKHMRLLLAELKKYSLPLFSFRYQAHMFWEQSIPSLVAYMATLIYNPNNVAFEGSPVTTCLEEQVGKDLCKMIGYDTEPGHIVSWGHLTGGGTIANMEALWAARNIKFFPYSIQLALKREKQLEGAKNVIVVLPNGTKSRLIDVDDIWSLLNIEADEALKLPEAIFEFVKDSMTFPELYKLLTKYSVQRKGLAWIYQEFSKAGNKAETAIELPVVLVSGTRHYSFPKAVSVLGLGEDSLINLGIDEYARLDINSLKVTLDECLKKRQPVIAVAAIIGSTEESAVDPLADILDKRKEYRDLGLEFHVHADAAWGGYFSTLVSKKQGHVPVIHLSDHVNLQFMALSNADSVTVDPHKSGYMPYPAGFIAHRNEAIKNMVDFTAPYLSTDTKEKEPVIGIYGIEGSKPGAAAAMVYLTHRVIPLEEYGYGVLLGQALYSTKQFYLNLLNLSTKRFITVPLALPPDEDTGPLTETQQKKPTEADFQKLRNIGPDLNVVAYAFNFYVDGKINTDLARFNKFNDLIYDRFRPQFHKSNTELGLFLSHTSLERNKYGDKCLSTFLRRLNIQLPDQEDYSVNVLRSVMMNPWITETEDGSFMKTIMKELKTNIDSVIDNGGF